MVLQRDVIVQRGQKVFPLINLVDNYSRRRKLYYNYYSLLLF